MKLNEQTSEALLREGLVPLLDLPKLLPPSASGRPMHRALGWRWVRTGVLRADGTRVRLEAVRVGKRWMTSRLALARFFDAQTREVRTKAAPAPGPATQSTLARFGLTHEGQS